MSGEANIQNAHELPVVAILAGGLGTRLGEISSAVPKSMVKVAGEPFIGHQLRRLAAQEFRDVVVCVGHFNEQIMAFVGDGSSFGCRVQYSLDGETLLGTGGSLRHALPVLGESFVVMYGDSYLRTPLHPIWKTFSDSGKLALMTVFRNDGQWDKSNIEFADGEIVRYDKRETTAAMRHIDYGLGCIRSEALAGFAPEGNRFDLALFYQSMLERRELAAFEVTERFYEIGSLAGLAETETLLAHPEEQRSVRG
jgi:NDP-sugar pyrophosphorylase family protein